MARVPYVDVSEMPEPLQRALGDQPPLNIFRALANAPRAARGFLGLVGALLWRGELDPQLRELVIVRVGLLSGAPYEVHQHRRLARAVGVPPEKLEALEGDLDEAVFTAHERDVLRFADAVVSEVKAQDELYEPVAAALSDGQMCELLLVIGSYMLVSRVLENLEVEIEQDDLIDVPREDGQRPSG
jgi:alkylhydroperoxidase family enzyme